MSLRDKIIATLAFLFFLVASSFLAMHFFLNPLMRFLQVKNWSPTHCTIVEFGTDQKDRLACMFRYVADGKTFSSDDYGPARNDIDNKDSIKRLSEKFPVGSTATCYVNPADPAEAVLFRDLPASSWMSLMPLVFVIVAVGWTVWANVLRRDRTMTDDRLRRSMQMMKSIL